MCYWYCQVWLAGVTVAIRLYFHDHVVGAVWVSTASPRTRVDTCFSAMGAEDKLVTQLFISFIWINIVLLYLLQYFISRLTTRKQPDALPFRWKKQLIPSNSELITCRLSQTTHRLNCRRCCQFQRTSSKTYNRFILSVCSRLFLFHFSWSWGCWAHVRYHSAYCEEMTGW